jgi:hypothetical protein
MFICGQIEKIFSANGRHIVYNTNIELINLHKQGIGQESII